MLHVAVMAKWDQLDFESFMHHSYFPDFISSNYYLFAKLTKGLGKYLFKKGIQMLLWHSNDSMFRIYVASSKEIGFSTVIV